MTNPYSLIQNFSFFCLSFSVSTHWTLFFFWKRFLKSGPPDCRWWNYSGKDCKLFQFASHIYESTTTNNVHCTGMIGCLVHQRTPSSLWWFLPLIWFLPFFSDMGVGRIFSKGGTIVDFFGCTKNIFPEGPKSTKFHFTHSKLRKRHFIQQI